MRKKIITPFLKEARVPGREWLDLDSLATVEISSEDVEYPVENALIHGQKSGWRAATPGKQTIRIKFDQPQQITRIWLSFEENETERTHQYDLSWLSDEAGSLQEIVRQQWNFSPSGATSEVQDLQVELKQVAVIELNIIPDISGGPALATLEQLKLG